MDIAQAFYVDVLQNIRAWKAAPPKLKRPTEEEVVEQVADAVGVEPQQVHKEVADDEETPPQPRYVEETPPEPQPSDVAN